MLFTKNIRTSPLFIGCCIYTYTGNYPTGKSNEDQKCFYRLNLPFFPLPLPSPVS
jgi:hypothetical protein